MPGANHLHRVRVLLTVFMAGLVVSGVCRPSIRVLERENA
jgi:hypothetical protein